MALPYGNPQKRRGQEFIQKIILRTPRTLKTTKRNTADREDNIVMKKCLILFGEYRNNREAIDWDSENLPNDWDSILFTWEGNTKYSIPENRFSDTKHKFITKPYSKRPFIELESWHAGSRGILTALESITEDYEHILIKRLDLLWKDVFTHVSDSKNKIWMEYGGIGHRWMNDYIFIGDKNKLLNFFSSIKKDIEINNPPANNPIDKNDAPIHGYWVDWCEKFLSEPPQNLMHPNKLEYELLFPKKL